MTFLYPADVICLTVQHLETATTWYQEKLGCRTVTLDEASEDTVVFEFEVGQHNLVISCGTPDTNSSLPPVFYAKKLSKAHELLSRRGVFVGPIQSDRGGNPFFEFQDMDGNTLEVCQEI